MTPVCPVPLDEEKCYQAWISAQALVQRDSPCWRCRTGARLRMERADMSEHDRPTPQEITEYLARLPRSKKSHDMDLDSV